MECTINAACEGLVQGVGCRMYRPSHRNGRLERNMVAVAFKWQLSERNDRLQMSLVSHNPAKFKCHDVTNVTEGAVFVSSQRRPKSTAVLRFFTMGDGPTLVVRTDCNIMMQGMMETGTASH
jgi:hypothetical protein